MCHACVRLFLPTYSLTRKSTEVSGIYVNLYTLFALARNDIPGMSPTSKQLYMYIYKCMNVHCCKNMYVFNIGRLKRTFLGGFLNSSHTFIYILYIIYHILSCLATGNHFPVWKAIKVLQIDSRSDRILDEQKCLAVLEQFDLRSEFL